MLNPKKNTNEIVEFFSEFLSEDKIVYGDAIPEDYTHDELGGVESAPWVIAKVSSTDEVSKIMSFANENEIPVVVRGSGTGLVGAAVAIQGGIMIDMLGMNKILELDEENLTVTVEPGVLLMELADFCENAGFLYPPDPGEKSATIGGNISTNAGGMRAVKYGVTREYVRALTVVLPNGKVVELGGKIVKNSSGYSLLNLIVGSEGTLGIITQATLRLIPLPQITTSLLVPFNSIQAAISAVPSIIKSKASLTAIEFFERQAILFAEDFLGKKFPDNSAPAYLLLTVDGFDASAIENELNKVSELCLELGADDCFIVDTDERKESVWNPRGAFLEAIKSSTDEMDECDCVVPRNKIAELVMYTHEVAKDLGVRIPSFGHAGDGNLHIYVCRDGKPQAEWEDVLNKAFDLMYAKSRELNGLTSGEHGIGYAKKKYMHLI